MKILVTGGAGFIGSYIVESLLERGYEVRVYDNLDPQVHGTDRRAPDYLDPRAELVVGDIRDTEAVDQALEGVEAVIHLAAAVGIGQSMYRINHYMEVNTVGTARLLELLVSRSPQVRKLIVASSMSIYGEGAYSCESCGIVYPSDRPWLLDCGLRIAECGARNPQSEIRNLKWEHRCPRCGVEVSPVPTDESKPLRPNSPYAISKKDQEELCLVIGRAYSIPTVALRFYNVYGPRQALSNPYTGAAAIFASRLLNGNPPVIYEDANSVSSRPADSRLHSRAGHCLRHLARFGE